MSLDSGLDNPSYVETEKPSNANGNGNVTYHSNGGVGYSNKSNGDLVAHEVEGDEGTVTMRSPEKNGLPHEARLSTISGTSQTELVGKDEEIGTCGWMSFRPRAIQHLYGPRGFLLFLCIFVLAQSMTCNGFVYVVTSTLERRFNLSSTKSGAISSAYDFTVMAIVVFVTYFGEKGHKPMWLGVGAIIFGIGSWMFTLPHFLTGPYMYGTTFEDTCPLNTTALDESICTDEENLSRYYGFFIVAQVLHGFGSCSIYTHGQTYIYNNVKAGEASMYIGIFMAVSTFAPALGYILGALFLSIFTDITNDSVDITVTSPLWVGAWWIGFIISGSLSLLVSIPLFAFPRNLPGWKEAELDRVNTAQAGSDFSMKAGFEGSIKISKSCLEFG
ncbi:putative solute carrier organic anion transporter family member 4A1 [Apostichopus japonicus]|uniref:Putative solute carrier organic anion transporter family member 4A1 n=1 Tax=Stichopus japonicus TaxID=307972 RepID=A0A2G8LAM5_STIJA|nr:putative solute carrier organic anion transporter family member 4A1 [Apostichopus japonicus]